MSLPGLSSSQVHADRREENGTFEGQGVSLSFHNIIYVVKKKVNDVPVCGKWEMKTILKDVSGHFRPGLNAIMGPTGSGKTSLLDVIAQRKDPAGLRSGTLLVNGSQPPANFRLLSGYVVQDDIVMGTLSVRENIHFSANLRLSKQKFSNQEIKMKVDAVIHQLGLQDCADTKVGNEMIRGISGGEKKRVNIGMELVLDPKVLFLDEPTTGLDANTANSIVVLLHRLVKQGRNVIFSIHQPRYSIFSLFDNLMMLQKGEIVFRGQCSEAVPYFSSLGYTCPQYHNPADYFLDIIGDDEGLTDILTKIPNHNAAFESNEKENLTSVQCTSVWDDRKDLPDKFRASEYALEQQNDLKQLYDGYQTQQESVVVGKVKDAGYANGVFRQLHIVSQRTFRNLIRNPITSFAQGLFMVFFGVLIGLIYYDIDTTTEGLQNRIGCFFFLIMSQVMSNLSALELFINNRRFFMHESASGYYRVSVYFIASIFADLLPHRLIPNFCFCCIIYFMIGFAHDAARFFFFFFAIVSTAFAATSAAYLVSSSVEVFALANLVLALPFLLMMMFGGFLVNIGSLLNWLEWIKWISIFRYGYNALVVNEMTGLVFYDNQTNPNFDPNSPTPCLDNVTHQRLYGCVTGEQYMDSQNIPYGAFEMWLNIIVLWSMTMFFLLLAYIQMRRINKYK